MPNVSKNEVYEINITGMTHEAQGVGRIDGFTVFVDGVLPDETAEVKIIKVTKSYAVGKLLNIEKHSQKRVEPFCSSYKRCGGCSLQHLSYDGQLSFKKNQVSDALKRIGKIEGAVIHDVIGMNDTKRYRNKAQFPVGMEDEKPVIGFYASRSHDIIGNESCGIQHAASDTAKEIVHEFMVKNNTSGYDEATGKGLVRHVVTRKAFATGEVMVVVVINGDKLPRSEELVKMLVSGVPGLESVYVNINKDKTNVILGRKSVLIHGKKAIVDKIGSFKFEISPASFFQVNSVQTEVLYGKALSYAGLTGKETVFDLYCGIGTISLFLSQKAAFVYGVESVADAVEDAKRNAKLNGVENVEFIEGEAEKVVPGILERGVKADVVVVDPPRKGCDEKLLETLVRIQPERIVYVSCNPSTLARDLGYLTVNGFRVLEVQPVDMFPYTAHVETVCLLTNKIKGFE
ncbi:MAG TPA: 23S rRNA (uracil(1939)-C(5))-methyltransferase RlmD [Clostridia bacterium]